MKKITLIPAVFILSAIFIAGCAGKGGNAAGSSLPETALNEPFATDTAVYTVSADETSGRLALSIKNTSKNMDAVTFKAFVTSELVTEKADAQIALYLREGQTRVFALPFTENDLPLTVYYTEEYGGKTSEGAFIKSEANGFTVAAREKNGEKIPRVEDITPESGEEKELEKNF